MGHRGADPPWVKNPRITSQSSHNILGSTFVDSTNHWWCSIRYLPLKKNLCANGSVQFKLILFKHQLHTKKYNRHLSIGLFPTLLKWLLYSRSFLRVYFMLIFYKENYVIWKIFFFAMFHYVQLPLWCSVAVILLLILRGKSIQVFTIKYGVSCTFR